MYENFLKLFYLHSFKMYEAKKAAVKKLRLLRVHFQKKERRRGVEAGAFLRRSLCGPRRTFTFLALRKRIKL